MRPRKNGRRPSSYPTDGCGTPLRITRMFPMVLKDVSVDKIKEQRPESNVVCISEMMALFECFEKSDFNANTCKLQADTLEQCYNNHMTARMNRKAEKKKLTNK